MVEIIKNEIVQVIIGAILTSMLGVLVASTKKLLKKIDAVHDGTKTLLQGTLLEKGELYLGRGWASYKELEIYENQYNAYRSLGGNGIVHEMHEKVSHLDTCPQTDRNRRKTDNIGGDFYG